MGRSRGHFIKYPRTPHLFGSIETEDDKHLNQAQSDAFIADESLIVEEKIDGTNVGIHFDNGGELVLQCRGHLITAGMHAQYDLFKQWIAVKRDILAARLGDRFILFGEWAHARHTIFYQELTHYFYEFDIYDKHDQTFLCLKQRKQLISGTGIETVPIIHTGPLKREDLETLMGPSAFGGLFENPFTNRVDNRMEGLYLRTESILNDSSTGSVAGRAKFVRPEFVEKIKRSRHWQHKSMVPNQLADGVDIWR